MHPRTFVAFGLSSRQPHGPARRDGWLKLERSASKVFKDESQSSRVLGLPLWRNRVRARRRRLVWHSCHHRFRIFGRIAILVRPPRTILAGIPRSLWDQASQSRSMGFGVSIFGNVDCSCHLHCRGLYLRMVGRNAPRSAEAEQNRSTRTADAQFEFRCTHSPDAGHATSARFRRRSLSACSWPTHSTLSRCGRLSPQI